MKVMVSKVFVHAFQLPRGEFPERSLLGQSMVAPCALQFARMDFYFACPSTTASSSSIFGFHAIAVAPRGL